MTLHIPVAYLITHHMKEGVVSGASNNLFEEVLSLASCLISWTESDTPIL